jgi:hypothetical protein
MTAEATLYIKMTEVEEVVKLISNFGVELKNHKDRIARVEQFLKDCQKANIQRANVDNLLILISENWPPKEPPRDLHDSTDGSGKVIATVDLGDDPDGDIEGVDYPPFPENAYWGMPGRPG